MKPRLKSTRKKGNKCESFILNYDFYVKEKGPGNKIGASSTFAKIQPTRP